MFAAGKTATVSGGAPDDKFNYVTMLLHGDGTNGAQNNTFLDSSTNNFTITRNGNTTQGSFSPYGSNWANYFDGSGDYLSTPSSITLGSGDLTIEGWAYPTNTSGGVFYDFRGPDSGSAGNNPVIQWSTVTASKFTVRIDGTNAITSSSTFSTNTWHHVALVRSGTTVTLYVNGTSQGTYTTSTSFAQAYVRIGAYGGDGSVAFTGYASNLRAVIGTAIYTTTFTPPTTPLTAVSGTALLTCQSNRFVDNSSNAYTITSTGNTSVQRFNPFGTSTAYSTSVIGGSVYYDGSGDSLSTPASSANIPQSGDDYTVEAWIYLTAAGNVTSIYSGDSSGYFAYRSVGRFEFVSGALELRLTYTAPLNRWCHVAVTRQSGTVRMFVDGALTSPTVSSGTTTGNTDVLITGTTYYFGSYTDSTSGPFYGYISNFRIVKGTAVYTAAFTPPTAPLTAITNTAILLNNTNAGIFDNAMMNDLETVGNAQISTSVVKYGTGSLAFDGTGDYLKGAYNPWLALGTGDYTIELWINFNSVSTSVFVGDIDSSGNGNWAFFYNSSVGVLRLLMNNSAVQLSSSSWTPSTSTWYHIAICRASGTYRFFVNGTVTGSGSDSTNITWGTNNYYVGSASDGGLQLNGYIDDLRITKGYARYTTTFTPPTSAFPDKGPY